MIPQSAQAILDGLTRHRIVLTLGAVACTFIVVAGGPIKPKAFGDEFFHVEAKALVDGIRNADVSRIEPLLHAPGPPLYYALPYLFVPSGSPEDVYWYVAVAWNFLWISVAVLLIQQTAHLLAGGYAWIAAAMVPLLFPMAVYYSFGVLAEPPAFLASAIIAYAWVILIHQQRTRMWILLCVGMTLLGIMRPNALFIFFFIAGAGSLLWLRGKAEGKNALVGALVAFCIFSAATAATQFGSKRPASFLWIVMTQGAFQFRSEPLDWRHWDRAIRPDSVDYADYEAEMKEIRERASAAGVPANEVQRQFVLASLESEPLTWLRMDAVRLVASQIFLVNSIKPADLNLGVIRGVPAYVVLHIFLNSIQIAMLVGALLWIITSRSGWENAGLWAPWLALTLFTALTYSEHRYPFPGQPGLVVLASCYAASLLRRVHGTR